MLGFVFPFVRVWTVLRKFYSGPVKMSSVHCNCKSDDDPAVAFLLTIQIEER